MKIAEQMRHLAELSNENKQIRDENTQLKEQNKKLEERIERLEALLASKVDTRSSKKPVFTENYSLERNKLGNQDSDKKRRWKSTGRKPREAKEHLFSDTIAVFPEGMDRGRCIHHRFQSAWRIVDGKAVYLRYDIRDLPDSTSLPLPSGIRNSRSEFGMEVIPGKACCTWIFSTANHVLFRCGVSRKKTEATTVLGAFFGGIGVPDDYVAYKSLFSEHQLCWAHLIRKAIKLVLQNPDETQYAETR